MEAVALEEAEPTTVSLRNGVDIDLVISTPNYLISQGMWNNRTVSTVGTAGCETTGCMDHTYTNITVKWNALEYMKNAVSDLRDGASV